MTPTDVWSAHTLDVLQRERATSGRAYLEFLRAPSMHAGLYELAAGARDLQEPHDADEIYYVVSGRARFSVGSEEVAAEPGSVLYVAAGVEHRFHTITEDLAMLVVFSG
ncbi:MAG: cupin domain-containing protein [Acidobacteriota bacterium]|nr:cupin domain-containing protein [Acidobacteriota bacterium]